MIFQIFFRSISAMGMIVLPLVLIGIYGKKNVDQFVLDYAAISFLGFFSKMGMDFFILRKNYSLLSLIKIKSIIFLFSLMICLSMQKIYQGNLYVFYSLPFLSLIAINASCFRMLKMNGYAGFFEVGSVALLATIFISLNNEMNFDSSMVTYLFSAAIVFFATEVFFFIFFKKKNAGKFTDIFEKIDFKESSVYVVGPVLIFLSQWICLIFASRIGDGFATDFSLIIRFSALFSFFVVTIEVGQMRRFFEKINSGDDIGIKKEFQISRRRYFPLAISLLLILFVAIYFLSILRNDIISKNVYILYLSGLLSGSYVFMFLAGPYQALYKMTGNEKELIKFHGVALISIVIFYLTLISLDVKEIGLYVMTLTIARIIPYILMHLNKKRVVSVYEI